MLTFCRNGVIWDRKIDAAIIEVAAIVAMIGIYTGLAQLLILTALLVFADVSLQIRQSKGRKESVANQ